MDASRFDNLLRAISAAGSRRSLLGALAATVLSGSDIKAKRCRNLNQSCKLPGKRTKKVARCCSGLRCHKRRCRIPECIRHGDGAPCGESRICCGGICLDVRADPTNCGACGRTCLSTERCLGGSCISTCIAGRTNCNGTCVDVLSDQDNCGDCGRVCPVGSQCQNGACAGSRCKDDGQACLESAECCRFPESVCLIQGGAQVCGRNCVGAAAECLNSAPGPFCCSGLTCVGGRCQQDQQPPCVPYGNTCSATIPCCDNLRCFRGLCLIN